MGAGAGKPLTSRSRQTQRTLESYLLTGAPPRWMERIMQIDNRVRRVKRELGERYDRLRAADPDGFPERWRAFAHTQHFDELNELIEQHNTWFPIERDLPMNPRTGEYIYVHGRDFRRPLLGPEWVLEHFPAA